MKKFGLVPEYQKNQEKGNGESSKLAEKHENVRIVPGHNIHINLSHPVTVVLSPYNHFLSYIFFNDPGTIHTLIPLNPPKQLCEIGIITPIL